MLNLIIRAYSYSVGRWHCCSPNRKPILLWDYGSQYLYPWNPIEKLHWAEHVMRNKVDKKWCMSHNYISFNIISYLLLCYPYFWGSLSKCFRMKEQRKKMWALHIIRIRHLETPNKFNPDYADSLGLSIASFSYGSFSLCRFLSLSLIPWFFPFFHFWFTFFLRPFCSLSLYAAAFNHVQFSLIVVVLSSECFCSVTWANM